MNRPQILPMAALGFWKTAEQGNNLRQRRNSKAASHAAVHGGIGSMRSTSPALNKLGFFMPVVFLSLIQNTTNHTGMKPMKHAAAIQILTQAAEVCENNAPINQEAGDWNQADLEIENAQAFRKAITLLNEHPDGV